MSRPRVTITFGRNGQRRATVSRDMYSDQINRGGNNKKRSVRERLGISQEQSSSFVRPPKRQRLDDEKWKHDLYEEKDEIKIRQPNGQDLRPDLRARLDRRTNARGHGEVSSTAGVRDLREKLSGPIQTPQVGREAAMQRRLSSVVRGSTGIASLATLRPGISRNSTIPQKGPILQKAAVHKAEPVEIDESTIGGLLHSLGLSKYLITFQAEEVDMAALRHMGDDDLKELGVPMGPRKKILLAVASRG